MLRRSNEGRRNHFVGWFFEDLVRRFATAAIVPNQANNLMVVRQLWGQLFLQASIQRPALQVYANRVHRAPLEGRYRVISKVTSMNRW